MEVGPRVDQEKAAGKCLAWSPQPILGSNQVLMVQAQRDTVSKGALQRENTKKEEKGQKIPMSKGHPHRTVQHDTGRPNRPTIH